MDQTSIDFSNQGIFDLSQINVSDEKTRLILSRNPLRSLNGLGKLHNISSIIARECRLTEFGDLSDLIGLLYISADTNQLQDFNGLEKSPQIKLLSLNKNYYESLDGLEKLPNLEMLYISENEIIDLQNLSGHNKLLEAYLSDNQITEIPELYDLDSLFNLDLARNKITRIKGLRNLSNLEYLDLDNNPIGIEGLEKILRYIESGFLPKLSLIKVDNCRIDWSSNYTKMIISELNKYQIVINNVSSKFDLSIPDYAPIKKIGEGGTFDVILIQKQKKKKFTRKDLLKDMGLPPEIEIPKIDKEKLLISIIEGIESKLNLRSVSDVSNNLSFFIDGLNRYQIIEELLIQNKEYIFLDEPTEVFHTLHLPKRINHSLRYTNLSGYRMIKKIGIKNLFDRRLQITKLLSGVRGIPEHYGVSIVDYSDFDGQKVDLPGIIEEYIDGQTLDSFLKEEIDSCSEQELLTRSKKDSMKEILEYFNSTLEVLYKIHQKGVIHVDISPNNILVTKSGEIYIIDYALSSTKKHDLMGFASRRMSSPEVLKNKKRIKPSSDLWSMGIILYAFLTGEHPIHNDPDTVIEIVSNKSEFKKFKIDYSGIYSPLVPIIQKSLMYNPKKRYQNCTDMKQDIKKAISNL